MGTGHVGTGGDGSWMLYRCCALQQTDYTWSAKEDLQLRTNSVFVLCTVLFSDTWCSLLTGSVDLSMTHDAYNKNSCEEDNTIVDVAASVAYACFRCNGYYCAL